MAKHIVDNLWQLDIPLEGNPLKNLNAYLIKGEKSLLIDTGFCWESCRTAMHRELEAVGVDQDKMDIFLTHMHSDHSGLAPELIRPGNDIFISSIDAPRIVSADDTDHWRRWYVSFLKEGFSEGEIGQFYGRTPSQGGAARKVAKFHLIQDGHTFHYGGHTLRCILTPGHTPGHMCLYEEENQWLFSGDHVLFHISPNICRWSGIKDSLGDYLDSLRKLRELPVKLLLPAHREETGELLPRVDELLFHHQRRLDNTLQVIGQEPGMNSYEIAGRMRWKIRSKSWEDFPLNQKIFAVGETLAHLDYLEERGLLRHEEKDGVNIYFLKEE